MENRFFFISTYDEFSGRYVSKILSTILGINCQHTHLDPLTASTPELNIKSNSIDDYVRHYNKSDEIDSYGNVGLFNAFELQHKIIAEKSISPIRMAKISLPIELRAKALIRHWLNSYKNPKHALSVINKNLQILQATKANLFTLYNFDYFHKKIIGLAKSKNINIDDYNELFITALSYITALDSADLPTASSTYHLNDLIFNEQKILDLADYISNSKNILDEQKKLKIREMANNAAIEKEEIENLPINEELIKITALVTKMRFETIYYPHVDKPLSFYYQADQVGSIFKKPESTSYSKLISIHLNSNRPAQLILYFDNIEYTCDHPEDVEVIVNIDAGDTVMESMLLKEKATRRFTIKYAVSPRPNSFCDLWKPINTLFRLSDPDAYFLLNISDEMLFATKGWDTNLKKYVGYFPDNIFRLRASRNKFRNYFDRWEASFAQDSIPITTRKWVEIGGNWNPCFGPDSFQQLVAFYLANEGKYSTTNYLRELPLLDIEFYGDVPALGIDHHKTWKLHLDHINAMLICQSHKMQLEARRRAVMLKAHIIAYKMQLPQFKIINRRKTIYLQESTSDQTYKVGDYKLSRLSIFLTNQFRKIRFFYYFGEGKDNIHNLILNFARYLKAKNILLQQFYKTASYYGGGKRFLFRVVARNPHIWFIKGLKKILPKKKINLREENNKLHQLCDNLVLENSRLKQLYLESAGKSTTEPNIIHVIRSKDNAFSQKQMTI